MTLVYSTAYHTHNMTYLVSKIDISSLVNEQDDHGSVAILTSQNQRCATILIITTRRMRWKMALSTTVVTLSKCHTTVTHTSYHFIHFKILDLCNIDVHHYDTRCTRDSGSTS